MCVTVYSRFFRVKMSVKKKKSSPLPFPRVFKHRLIIIENIITGPAYDELAS